MNSRSAAAALASGFRIIPFAGAGAGVVQYKETSDFAQPGDDVDESFTSYHFIGGVEVPLWKFLGVGAEYHHRWVPDALGTGGVSEQFNEDGPGRRDVPVPGDRRVLRVARRRWLTAKRARGNVQEEDGPRRPV